MSAEPHDHDGYQPLDHDGYQPLDPSRAAVPQRPLCATSSIERGCPGRHRVGPLPIVVMIGPHRYPLCSMACLELLVRDWRARRAAARAEAALARLSMS